MITKPWREYERREMREQIIFFPRDLLDEIERRADASGVSWNEYVVSLLAEVLGGD